MGRDGDGKNAKMDVSSFASDGAPVTMEWNAVVHVVETDEIAAVAASRNSEGTTPPVIACIAQPSPTNSSTNSSLSDDSDNQADEEEQQQQHQQQHPQMSSVMDERDDNSNSEGLENAALVTQAALGPATQAVGAALGHPRLLTRATYVKSFSAVSAHSEESSHGASSVHGSSAGTWGWFEDVHTHDNIDISTGDLIPNGAEAVSAGKKKASSVPQNQLSAGNNDVNQSTAGDATGTKKKGGLLQFGNAMSADSRALVPPPPNNNESVCTGSHYTDDFI
eukprot:scaffold46916_cov55-Attheya_sp.AAC.4